MRFLRHEAELGESLTCERGHDFDAAAGRALCPQFSDSLESTEELARERRGSDESAGARNGVVAPVLGSLGYVEDRSPVTLGEYPSVFE